jgi:hypothetical protein
LHSERARGRVPVRPRRCPQTIPPHHRALSTRRSSFSPCCTCRRCTARWRSPAALLRSYPLVQISALPPMMMVLLVFLRLEPFSLWTLRFRRRTKSSSEGLAGHKGAAAGLSDSKRWRRDDSISLVVLRARACSYAARRSTLPRIKGAMPVENQNPRRVMLAFG